MSSPARHISNEITSGVLHLIGALASVTLLILLITFAALHGTAWHVAGFTVYGIGMTLLYIASTLYHLIPHTKEKTKEVFRRLDHGMVYFLIASTYTPVCFLVLTGASGWWVFGILWVLAILGSVLKFANVKTHPAIPVILYLVMGWMIIFFIQTLLVVMSTAAFTLLVAGGISYTIGVIFFALESKVAPRKYFWMHEIFHVFVLGGSTLHTIMMFYLL